MRDFIERLPRLNPSAIEGRSSRSDLVMATRNGISLRHQSWRRCAGRISSAICSPSSISIRGAAVLGRTRLPRNDPAYFQKGLGQCQACGIFFDRKLTPAAAFHRHRIRGIQPPGRAETRFGLTSKLILSFLRHLSEEDAFKTLEEALPLKDWIVASASTHRARKPAAQVRARVRACASRKVCWPAPMRGGGRPRVHLGSARPAEVRRSITSAVPRGSEARGAPREGAIPLTYARFRTSSCASSTKCDHHNRASFSIAA